MQIKFSDVTEQELESYYRIALTLRFHILLIHGLFWLLLGGGSIALNVYLIYIAHIKSWVSLLTLLAAVAICIFLPTIIRKFMQYCKPQLQLNYERYAFWIEDYEEISLIYGLQNWLRDLLHLKPEDNIVSIQDPDIKFVTVDDEGTIPAIDLHYLQDGKEVSMPLPPQLCLQAAKHNMIDFTILDSYIDETEKHIPTVDELKEMLGDTSIPNPEKLKQTLNQSKE